MYDIQFGATTVGNADSLEDLSPLLKQLAEERFPAVELDSRWLLKDEDAAEVRNLCYEHQIAPLSGVWEIDLTSAQNGDNATALKIIDALDSLGAEYLVISPVTPEKAHATNELEKMNGLILQLGEKCAETGLKASLLIDPSVREKATGLISQFDTSTEEILGWALHITLEAPWTSILTDFLRQYGSRSNYLHLSVSSAAVLDSLSELRDLLEEVEFTGWIVVHHSGNSLPRSQTLQQLEQVFNS